MNTFVNEQNVNMQPELVASVVIGYFVILIITSWLTSRYTTRLTFFSGDRSSPWFLVAFGMVGASLSGITFISVPGMVADDGFSYMQVVLGYFVGYVVIIKVLLPIYYKENLISIYGYLLKRFGMSSYLTGASFFLISRVIGASFRLFLVAGILQIAFFDYYNIPFSVTVATTIVLIWLYTFRGGIKTIVWTDTLQTACMLITGIFTLYWIDQELQESITSAAKSVTTDDMTKIFHFGKEHNFFTEFFSGMFIAIVMTGLDQDMMQKNLTIKTLKNAQKNIFWFSIILIFVNFLFLSLGSLLYYYAEQKGISLQEFTPDQVYPHLAINHFPTSLSIVFLLGIIAAAYSSADSALTALTTSFCVDILGRGNAEKINRNTRIKVHVSISILLFFVILSFQLISDDSIINSLFKAAGFTYGPLLGLFTVGIFTKWKIKDHLSPYPCIIAPLLSFGLFRFSEILFYGYQIGFEILLINGALTIAGLFMIRDE